VEDRCSSSCNELDIVVVALLRVGREEWKGLEGRRGSEMREEREERGMSCIQEGLLRGDRRIG